MAVSPELRTRSTYRLRTLLIRTRRRFRNLSKEQVWTLLQLQSGRAMALINLNQLRFDILEEVEKRLPGFPIVLHGASSVIPEYVETINKYGGKMPDAIGIPEDMLRKAASMAVCKINIDSDLRLAMTAAIREHFAEAPSDFDPRQYLKPARENIKKLVKHKLVDVLGCNNKA